MSYNSKQLKVQSSAKKLPKPKDVDYISKMGYRDDSPFRDNPYNDIYTPNGIIDMSQTGIPLFANGQYLPPYSGMHDMGTENVREIPVAKKGGQKGLRKFTSKNIQTSLNDIMQRNTTLFGPSGKKRYKPDLNYKYGGWLDQYQTGSQTKANPLLIQAFQQSLANQKINEQKVIDAKNQEIKNNPLGIKTLTTARDNTNVIPIRQLTTLSNIETDKKRNEADKLLKQQKKTQGTLRETPKEINPNEAWRLAASNYQGHDKEEMNRIINSSKTVEGLGALAGVTGGGLYALASIPAIANTLGLGFAAHGVHSLPSTYRTLVDPNESVYNKARALTYNTADFLGMKQAAEALKGVGTAGKWAYNNAARSVATSKESGLLSSIYELNPYAINLNNANKGTKLDLENLRKVYHNAERFLQQEESRFLHKHGHGLRENYARPRLRENNFIFNINNQLPPPPSEIKFMPDGTTRTVYNQQPISDYVSGSYRPDYIDLRRSPTYRILDWTNYPNLTRDELSRWQTSNNLNQNTSNYIDFRKTPLMSYEQRNLEDIAKLEKEGISKDDINKFIKIKDKTKSNITDGTLSFTDSQLNQHYSLLDKELLPISDKIDNEIKVLSNMKEKLEGNSVLSKDLTKRLEDLHSTKFLRTNFINDITKRGFKPTMKNMSIVTSKGGIKYLLDDEGKVLGNMTLSGNFVGTAAVNREYHGVNEIGKQNQVAEALYRGIHHGIKNVHGTSLQSHGSFATTNFVNPTTGKPEITQRAKNWWESKIPKEIAKKENNIYSILKKQGGAIKKVLKKDVNHNEKSKFVNSQNSNWLNKYQ